MRFFQSTQQCGFERAQSLLATGTVLSFPRSVWGPQAWLEAKARTREVGLQSGRRGIIVQRMERRSEEDFEEVFSRSRGPGGQHVNKVSTAVTLRHVPSGLRVTVSDSRSQAANRVEARRRLMEKLREAVRAEKQGRLAEAARERRRKARRSRGTKAKMVEAKRRRSETKKLRSCVGS